MKQAVLLQWWLLALLCNLQGAAGAVLLGKRSGTLDTHSSRLNTSVALDTGDCLTIQPASLLQKVTHPWTGDYKTRKECKEIAILTNTAQAGTCTALHLTLSFTLLIGLCFGAACYAMLGGPAVAAIIAAPFAISWYYMLSTGLLSDYKSGAMSWDASFTHFHPHNCSAECLQFVQLAYTLTVILVFYAIFFTCIFGSSTFMVRRMQLDRAASTPFLPEGAKEEIESSEFRSKCIKAFRDADANHDGVLDLSELQEVAMFDLTDEEKAYVKEHALFKEAFEKCDADKNNTIDQEEFIEVMKFIATKAKAGVYKDAEENFHTGLA